MADPYRKLQKQIASLGPGTEFLESLYNDMISSGELDPNTTYEEFVAMDPLNTFDIDREQRAGGGMMDINTMTAPLGYALGGPAGMVGRPTSDPELYEGYDPILGNWMKDRKMRQAQPPAGAVDMTGQYVAPPERPRWEKARELGKKGLEGIKKLGSKSLGALKYAVEELIGAGAAEGSEYYISPDEAKGMTKEELEKEIHGFNPYEFGGQGYSYKNLRTIQIVIDELMSRLGDD
jgi:hypothetical protein